MQVWIMQLFNYGIANTQTTKQFICFVVITSKPM